MAVGEFTPGVQDSVWMILERVDVPSAPGYTVTNNTEVTMTSGGLVTIDSMPWTKITGKPTLFTANQTLNTSDSVSFNRLTVTSASGIEGGEIQLAKELPEPEVSRTEYDLKDQLIRETIISTEEKVDANSQKLDKIDEKLYEIIIKN